MRRGWRRWIPIFLAWGCGQADDGLATGPEPGTAGTQADGGSDGGAGVEDTDTGIDDGVDPGADDGAEPTFDLGGANADDTTGGGSCEVQDLLVVLDRSLGMRRRPSDNEVAKKVSRSKWGHAVAAVESFAWSHEAVIDIGLELVPSPSDADHCAKFSNISDKDFKGFLCEVGAGAAPGAANAATIDAMLDPGTTRLCRGKPLGRAIEHAGETLALDGAPSGAVVLVTDGKNDCDGDPVAATKLLAQTGVRIFAIGFGASLDHATLNRIACAGRTASGFADACVEDELGNYEPVDPSGPALFLAAQDGAALESVLAEEIAGALCCEPGCSP